MIDRELLASQIRFTMRRHGLSLRQTAKLAGVSAPFIQRMTKHPGEHDPQLSNVEKLIDWMGLSFSDFETTALKKEKDRSER